MRRLAIWAALLPLLALPGCIAAVAGAGATGGVMAAQDRGFEQGIDDNEIAFEINRKLAATDAALFKRVSTQISHGRVVLIGTVAKPEDRLVATRIARDVGGVKQVIDELQVGTPPSFSESAGDKLISTKLRAAITGDGDISSINYSIDTLRGTVYLMGIAQDRAEHDRVVAHARAVSGVRNVISNVEVKSAQARQ